MIATSKTKPNEFKKDFTHFSGISPYSENSTLNAIDLPKDAAAYSKYTHGETNSTTQGKSNFSQVLGKYSLKSGSDSSLEEVRNSSHLNLRKSVVTESIKESNREFALKNLAYKRDTLAKQRYQLFKKKITIGITNKEAVELRYIEWQLERIEDAHMSPMLVELKNKTDERRALSKEIKRFVQSVNVISTNKKR